MSDLRRRSLVILNTKDCCFFCLKQIVKEEIDDCGGNDPGRERGTGSCLFSLLTFCNYLKIRLNSEIGKEVKTVIGDLVSGPEVLEVEVSTCSSCGELGKRFTELVSELERIKLEVDYSLKSLQNKMISSSVTNGEDAEVRQNYYERMESDEDSKSQIQIVDKLRMDIKMKSQANHLRSPNVNSTRISRKERSSRETATLATSVDEEKEELDTLSVPETIIKQEIEDFHEGSPPASPKQSPSPGPRQLYSSFTKPHDSKTASSRINDSKEVIQLPFNFKCDRCNKPFGKRDNLRKHKKNCKGAKTRLTRRWNARFLKTFRVKGSKCVYNPETGKYKCSLCSKELSASGCRYHFEAIHLPSKFECDLCHAVYNREYRLKVHRKTCNGIRPKPRKLIENEKDFVKNNSTERYDCLTCGKSLSSKYNARVHVSSVHVKPKMKKQRAKKTRKPKSGYFNSRFNHETGKHQCQACFEEFNSNWAVTCHFDLVHLQKTFECEKCHLILKNRFILRNHQKYHCKAGSAKDKETEVHICEICGKEYNNSVSLSSHKRAYHRGFKSFCKYCQKEFTNQANFNVHERNQVCQRPDYYRWVKKPELEGHKCDICKVVAFESNTSEDFLRHREECLQKRMEMEQRVAERGRVTGKGTEQVEGGTTKKKRKPAPPSACHICGKWFAHKTSVSYHVRQVHLNERKFICDLCGKSYKDITQLKRHKSFVHLGEVLTCEVCKAEFKSWNSLKHHKKKCGKGQDGAAEGGEGQMGNPGPSTSV